MGYLIYGKVVKPVKIGQYYLEPQAQFRALTYDGVRVTKLSDADDYATKEDAEFNLNYQIKKLEKKGIADCVAFEIRKAR